MAIPLSSLKLQVTGIDFQHCGRTGPAVTERGSFPLFISIGRHIVDIITNLELVFEQSVNIRHLVEICHLSLVHLSHHQFHSGTEVKQMFSWSDCQGELGKMKLDKWRDSCPK